MGAGGRPAGLGACLCLPTGAGGRGGGDGAHWALRLQPVSVRPEVGASFPWLLFLEALEGPQEEEWEPPPFPMAPRNWVRAGRAGTDSGLS